MNQIMNKMIHLKKNIIKKYNYNDLNISALDDCAFRMACFYGHLPIIQWLLQLKPYINISIENEYPFSIACSNGHLHLAQFLLKLKPDINISVSGECPFIDTCNNAHLLILVIMPIYI